MFGHHASLAMSPRARPPHPGHPIVMPTQSACIIGFLQEDHPNASL